MKTIKPRKRSGVRSRGIPRPGHQARAGLGRDAARSIRRGEEGVATAPRAGIAYHMDLTRDTKSDRARFMSEIRDAMEEHGATLAELCDAIAASEELELEKYNGHIRPRQVLANPQSLHAMFSRLLSEKADVSLERAFKLARLNGYKIVLEKAGRSKIGELR